MVSLVLVALCASVLCARDPERHWAFRNFGAVSVPATANPHRTRAPIDAFILPKLEAKNLNFAPDAARATLLRRAYLDILGLPPALADIDAFLNDARPDAWERVVDRLLASPRFGERWARHWLDVVGYADSVGFDMNPGGAVLAEGKWRYRDYVIDAFNADKPYDRFIREQLAGDESIDWRRAEKFTPKIRELLVATGFLRTAQDFTHEPISDIPSNHYAVLHDTVEILGASLFALTLKCARCHDHKFDPVSQEDYYRLMACLTPAYNSRDWRAVIPYRPHIVDRALPDVSAARRTEIEQENAPIDREIEELKAHAEAVKKLGQQERLGPWYLVGPFPAKPGTAFATVFPPENGVDLARTYRDGTLAWTKRDDWKNGDVHSLSKLNNVASYVYRTIDADEDGRAKIAIGSAAGVKLWLNGNLVYSRDVLPGDSADPEPVFVPLRNGTNHLLMKVANRSSDLSYSFRVLELAGTRGEELAKIDSQIDELSKRRRTWGKIQALWDVGPPPPTHLLIRGDLATPGHEVRPGFLGVLTGPDNECFAAQRPVNPGTSGRRTALARCVTRPGASASALLARVMVNRVWQHVFGTGLVSTAGNFGVQGQLPTHPALLEWLSANFVRGEWRMKSLIRDMITSTAYRQASRRGGRARRHAESVDPNNSLLWRMRLRRVDAEVVRDSLLALGEGLDTTMGGEAIPTVTNPDGRVVAEGDGAQRRSIYLLVRRAYNPSLLSVFDQPVVGTTCSRRQPSAVVSQSLTMMNDAFLFENSASFARRVQAMPGASRRDEIETAFRLVLTRRPNENERRWSIEFLDRQTEIYRRAGKTTPQHAALVEFCHTLLNTSEFLYTE